MSTKQILRQCSIFANEAYDDNIQSLEGSILLENLPTDTQIHIGKQKSTIYIVGRGTANMKDALHDLKIWRRKCSFLQNTLIHTGFLQQYEAIRDNLLKELKELLSEDIKRIVCTGHSLGAALMTIAALDIQLLYSDISVESVTFASPRVGSPGFSELFNKTIKKSYRYVFHRDPVTFIPICLRFRHVKGLIHFKKNGTTEVSEDYFFPIGCLVSQHYMEKYKCIVAKILDENTHTLDPLFKY